MAPVAQAQIEPTWMYRTTFIRVSNSCHYDFRGESTSEPGPWEQGLAIVAPCPAGSAYALGSHRSNIGQDGLEAAASLSVGLHGVRFFDSNYYLIDEYIVQFQVPQSGYYRFVSNTGVRVTSIGEYSDIHLGVQAIVVLNPSDESWAIWCLSQGHPGGDQSDSRRALLHLDPGQYDIGGSAWLEGQMITYRPDQMSVHLRYDLSLTPVACPADINADERVDTADLTLLLSHLGEYADGSGTLEQYDIDGSLWVDAEDLAILLSVFGQACD